jgi:replicative DNA helicase
VAQEALKRALRAQAAEDEQDEAGPTAQVQHARHRLRSIQAEIDAEDGQRLKPYALLADDSTPEALQRQMVDQDGRVGIVSPESELFAMAAGRYSDSGPKVQTYVSGFTGERLRGDRITRALAPIERPGLAVVISVQPVVFEMARANPILQQRGLLARFLYAVPTSYAGTRRLCDRPMNPVAIQRDYADHLMGLCRLGDMYRSAAPVRIQIVGDAGRELERWHDECLEPRRHRLTGDLGATVAMASWAARLHGVAARIAAVLHVSEHLRDAGTTPVSVETMEKAIAICEWAVDHAFAAFGIGRLDRIGQDALRLRRWYLGDPATRSRFTLRDANRAIRGLDAAGVRTAIQRLEDQGYVRVGRSAPGRVGRPSSRVEVNPADLTAS